MVATSVRVPAHLLREVDALAKELDYSRNEVVQFCLEFAIETHREQQRKKMQEPKESAVCLVNTVAHFGLKTEFHT
jgi:metal-responsive CopG/Arc/MetJ family transcriptional regulator